MNGIAWCRLGVMEVLVTLHHHPSPPAPVSSSAPALAPFRAPASFPAPAPYHAPAFLDYCFFRRLEIVDESQRPVKRESNTCCALNLLFSKAM